MTYEQASARGLVFKRTNDSLLTYRDGIVHHFTAAMTTAVTAAKNRERLMRDFYEFRKTATEEGEREYVIVPGVDPSRARRLAVNLATQGVDVQRAEEPIRIGNRTVPARLSRLERAADRTPRAQPARSADRPGCRVRQGTGSAPAPADGR